MKTILTFFLLTTNLLVFCQNQVSGNFKIHKIFEADKYYLIFLRKDDLRYTIFSEKGIALRGKKIQEDSIYKFDLYPIRATLPGGTSAHAMNYLDYRTFPQFSNAEIGLLCRVTNLIGITIIPESDEYRIKEKRHKKIKKEH